jgi:mono/diheme cytochrome c family protein
MDRRRIALVLGGAVLAVFIAGVTGLVYVRATGLNAMTEPGTIETRVARIVRRLAIPASIRTMANPIPTSAESVGDGMAHFADHCAVCHANDGSGDTEMGRGLYPKAPDMRLAATQQLSDGELFYVIEHGIRFTGMPGWRNGTKEGEESSWQLVHFIRHLPKLTAAELDAMKARNPKSPEEIRFEIEEERFLNQGAQR